MMLDDPRQMERRERATVPGAPAWTELGYFIGPHGKHQAWRRRR